MVKINSFFAIRPEKKIAHRVASKAYKDYSKKDIRQEIKKNKYSFLNIIQQDNKIAKNKYELIRKKIKEFEENNFLINEKNKSLFVYQQIDNKKNKFTGLICTIDTKDYLEGKIKIHEHTIKKRELLFSKYLAGTKIHAEPVLLTYNSNIDFIQNKHMSNKQLVFSFKTNDEKLHSVWRISDEKEIQKIQFFFSKLKNLYIADGHHRLASSASNQSNGKCLAYIVPKSALITHPFHRYVKTNMRLVKKFKDSFKIEKIENPQNYSDEIQFYNNKKWYRIIETNKMESCNLMIQKITNNIFQKILKISDERTSERVEFVPGNQDINLIINKLKSSEEVLFYLKPISIDEIIKLADQNQTTPAKSTFILPKIPSGLIMMKINEL